MVNSAVALVLEAPDDLEAAYAAYLAGTGRGNVLYERCARQFLDRWPDPQAWANEPLATRLAADKHTRPLLTFLMLHAGFRPG
jgi:hypothetical protein